MKKYFVYCNVETLISIDDRKTQQLTPKSIMQFNFDNSVIYLKDSLKQHDNCKLHNGLDFIVEIKANDENEAINKSKVYIEDITNIISFIMLTACESARFISIIEINENSKFSSFQENVYPLNDTFLFSSLVKINKDILDEIWSKFWNELNIKTDEKQRIMRSMSWFRKGLNETNNIIEFISYWIGIEAVKCILRDKIKFKAKKPKEWDGVKDIITSKLGYYNFDDQYILRQEIFHGFESLNDMLINRVEGSLSILRNILIASICSILNLSDESFGKIISQKVRKKPIELYQKIKVNFERLPATFYELVKSYPKTEINNKKFKISIDNEGEIELNYCGLYKFVPQKKFPQSVKVISEIWGDPSLDLISSKQIIE